MRIARESMRRGHKSPSPPQQQGHHMGYINNWDEFFGLSEQLFNSRPKQVIEREAREEWGGEARRGTMTISIFSQ